MDTKEIGDAETKVEARRFWPVLFLALGAAILVLLAAYLIGWKKSAPKTPDWGSAPEGTPTFYTHLTATAAPAEMGAFSNRTEDGGPIHRNAAHVWLGSAPGGDFDDGVAIPPPPGVGNGQAASPSATLMPCSQNRLVVLVSTEGLTEAQKSQTAYLNLFADWNRDGRFDGGDGCASEWALQNHELSLSTISEGINAVAVSIPTGEQTFEFWMRATITVDEPADGPKPRQPFAEGETEDVLVTTPPSRGSSHPGRAGCFGSLPPAIAGGTSATVPGRISSDGLPDDSAVSPLDISVEFDTATETIAQALLDPSSKMATLSPSRVELPTYGFVAIGSERCRFVTLPSTSENQGLPGSELDSERITLGVETPSKKSRLPVAHCSDTKAFSGGSAIVPVHMFAAQSELPSTKGEYPVSLLIRDPDLPLTPTPEATPTGNPAPDLYLVKDDGGAIRAVSIRAPTEIKNRRYVVEIRSTSGGPITTSCSLSIFGPQPQTTDASDGPENRAGGTPRLGGDYDVTFSKKSDSCGTFELKSVEWVRIRQYGERIEIQRAAGNLSSGQTTSAGSFRATGSGHAKDGTPYIESYNARVVPDGFAGSYDLQRDGCRASFDIEGIRR